VQRWNGISCSKPSLQLPISHHCPLAYSPERTHTLIEQPPHVERDGPGTRGQLGLPLGRLLGRLVERWDAFGRDGAERGALSVSSESRPEERVKNGERDMWCGGDNVTPKGK